MSDCVCVMNIGKHLMVDGEGQVIDQDEYDFKEAEEVKWIQSHLDNPGDLLIIAQVIGNDPTSSTTVGLLNFEAPKRRKISHTGEFGMGIHKDYRGNGLGKLMLEHLIEWAKSSQQIEKINLRVLENNTKAIEMYKRYGFKENGRKTKEVKISEGNYLDDLSMELLL